MNVLAEPTSTCIDDTLVRNMNSRRSPPATSKSLPPHKKQKVAHNHSKEEITVPKLPQSQTDDSQGSSSDQSASKWFDQVNKNIPQSHAVPTPDDESPFFLTNQQGYRLNSLKTSEAGQLFGSQYHNDSENADLRGVIDDLTIENKRLKQLLKDQRTQSSPDTENQEKLFEIRLHGLPASKKRELEHLLKTFATTVHNSPKSGSSTSATHGSGISSGQLLSNNPSKPSQETKLVHTDSGYASNSNSGATSNGHGSSHPQTISKSSRDKNIQNYLHDIPDTLLPRQSPLKMSERAKMVLVVRRLEQLFTGKESSGDRSQPIQQQEVSQSAARADQTEALKNKHHNRPEGLREAHMMPVDTKINLDAMDTQEPVANIRPLNKKIQPSGGGMTEQGSNSPNNSPDQRPTRPLDLDIHRAQLATDNIEYIRHLGMSPHLDRPDEADASSWIYLNLMMSLAQLHTINVTPSFIRKAIRKLSTKFELSKDGHRIRWKGGAEGTIFTKEEERALETTQDAQADAMDYTGPTSSKRSKTNSSSNVNISNTASEDKTSAIQQSDSSRPQVSTSSNSILPNSNPTRTSQTSSKFEYKPLFYNGKKKVLLDTYLDSSSSYESTSGDSNGLVSALSRSNLNTYKPEEGTITFFNNPFFYSDVSADNAPVNWQTSHRKLRCAPIGIPQDFDFGESPLRYHDGCYFMPQFGPKPFRSTESEPDFDMKLKPFHTSGEAETRPLELPASGVGGVVPEDNFALDVTVERMKVNTSKSGLSRKVPYTQTNIPMKYSYQTRDCQQIELFPSALPPPNYIFFTSSSSGDNIDDIDIEDWSDSTSSADEHEPAPPAFLHHWSTGTSNDGDADENNLYDDSSVDMLQAAKAADPVRVAAQEREYIINQPGGAVKIEGSLAATVGASRSASIASGKEVDSDLTDDGQSDEEMDFDD